MRTAPRFWYRAQRFTFLAGSAAIKWVEKASACLAVGAQDGRVNVASGNERRVTGRQALGVGVIKRAKKCRKRKYEAPGMNVLVDAKGHR